MIFISVLVIIVFLIANCIIAAEFENIAEKKGYAGKPYFWYTFLFGIAGMLMVIALPINDGTVDRKKPQKLKKDFQVPKMKEPIQKIEEKDENNFDATLFKEENYINVTCGTCGHNLSFLKEVKNPVCPWCNSKVTYKEN